MCRVEVNSCVRGEAWLTAESGISSTLGVILYSEGIIERKAHS